MKRLVFVLLLLVAGVACVGWYRGWFGFSVDLNRIQADENKVNDLGHRAKEAVEPAAK